MDLEKGTNFEIDKDWPRADQFRFDARLVLTTKNPASNEAVRDTQDIAEVKKLLPVGASLIEEVIWTQIKCKIFNRTERVEDKKDYGTKDIKSIAFCVDESIGPKYMDLQVQAKLSDGKDFYVKKRYFAQTRKDNIIPIADVYHFANGSKQVIAAKYDPNDLLVSLTNRIDDQIFDQIDVQRSEEEMKTPKDKITIRPVKCVIAKRWKDAYTWENKDSAEPTAVVHVPETEQSTKITYNPGANSLVPKNYPPLRFVLGGLPPEYQEVQTKGTGISNLETFVGMHIDSDFWTSEAQKLIPLAKSDLRRFSLSSAK